MKKIGLTFAAALALVFGVAQGVSAQYGPSAGGSDAAPGGETEVAVNGCQPGEQVTIDLPGFENPPQALTRSVQTINADAEGNAFTVFVAPNAPGTYPGTATCGVLTANFSVTVLDVPPDTNGGGSGGQLPSTGSGGQSSITYVAVGLLVVGLGLFAVAGFRRRQPVTT